MKTIFLYGMPGVGKLTVAKELSKITGFSNLHNHLINDLVATTYEFGIPEFWKVVHKYRLDIMKHAEKAGRKGIILTMVYAKPSDDLMLGKIVKQARENGGEVFFVHLTCTHKELLKRIKSPSRKMFKKIKLHKTLKKVIARNDLLSDVPYKDNLVIDNTKISPVRAAGLIKKHYKL